MTPSLLQQIQEERVLFRWQIFLTSHWTPLVSINILTKALNQYTRYIKEKVTIEITLLFFVYTSLFSVGKTDTLMMG